ncbi:hypothetical protein SETIT_1G037100v2 [Setaria italica]|uniref:Uncharacterized protein n=1 Tax=Setaria italica TaxID=4555 RepID=A0A368PGV1_SETIT|nr:hypothetical protein SETIT_1G037100v2 [Setaria italica]
MEKGNGADQERTNLIPIVSVRSRPTCFLFGADNAPPLHAHPDRAYRPPDAPLRCSCASAQPTDRRTCSPVARRRRRSQGFFFQNVDVGIDIC